MMLHLYVRKENTNIDFVCVYVCVWGGHYGKYMCI
jgi:hypothetical protein